MTILDFPYTDISAPASIGFRLVPRTQVFVSPLNGGDQTLELPGARWVVSATWSALTKAEIRRLRAFVVQLRGRSGRFRMHDLSHPLPAGVATGTPLVNVTGGAWAGASSVATDGWTAATAGILKAGDYFQFANGELKLLVADASSDANGRATLTFEPPLRGAAADNSALTTVRPSVVLRLKDDDQDHFAVRGSLVMDYTLDAEEAFT